MQRGYIHCQALIMDISIVDDEVQATRGQRTALSKQGSGRAILIQQFGIGYDAVETGDLAASDPENQLRIELLELNKRTAGAH
jgi:hypothetical protein